MAEKIKKIEELPYEVAFTELGNIVESLETGEHTLEEAMALFERGQVLAKHSAMLLDKAELKVKQLSDDSLLEFRGEE